eukprot:1138848-Pelagomonas_calceolata.AAC.13
MLILLDMGCRTGPNALEEFLPHDTYRLRGYITRTHSENANTCERAAGRDLMPWRNSFHMTAMDCKATYITRTHSENANSCKWAAGRDPMPWRNSFHMTPMDCKATSLLA